MQIPFNFLDSILFTIETVIFSAGFFAVVLFASLFFRSLTSAILMLIIGTALIAVPTLIFLGNQIHSVFSGAYYEPDNQLEACRWLMFYIGLGLTGGATMLIRYGSRSMIISIGTIITGVLFSFAFLFHWPIRLDLLISPATYASVSPSLKEKIHFHLVDPHIAAYPVWKGPGEIQAIDAEVNLAGLEPPYFPVETDFKAEAPQLGLSSTYDYGVVHATGMTPHSMYGMAAAMPLGSPLLPAKPAPPTEESLRDQVAGFTPSTPTQWGHYYFNVFSYPLGPSSHDFNWYGKMIQGNLTLEIRRMFVAEKVHVLPKSSFGLPRRRYELEIPEMERRTYLPEGHPEIICSLTTKRVPLILRGDYAPEAMNLSWLMVNRPANGLQGEYLVMDWGSFSDYFISTPVFFSIQRTSGQLERPGRTDKDIFPAALIPHDWLDAAEIYVFDTESCGQVSFPYALTGQ